jgi:hypothetical protein
MTHAWQPTVLAPARLDKGRPAVPWWPKCGTCGTQVCQTGYGSKAQVFYRPTSSHEWESTEPPCVTVQSTIAHDTKGTER